MAHIWLHGHTSFGRVVHGFPIVGGAPVRRLTPLVAVDVESLNDSQTPRGTGIQTPWDAYRLHGTGIVAKPAFTHGEPVRIRIRIDQQTSTNAPTHFTPWSFRCVRWSRTGHWCLALRLLQTAGLVTTVTAGAALSATVRRGEWSLAGQLLDALVFEHRVDISRVCWNVALSSCDVAVAFNMFSFSFWEDPGQFGGSTQFDDV